MATKPNKQERIVYSLNVEDIENVADEEFSIKLTRAELKLVEDKLGDYIDWHDAIAEAIRETLGRTRDIN